MRKTRGQTLMELLVAVSVIATGMFAAADLALSNVKLADRDADELVVVNLLREGIELARVRRDSNWLAGRAFNDGLHDGTDYTAVPLWNGDEGTDEVSFDFTADNFQNKATIVFKSTLAETQGFFQQEHINGDAMPFSRLLTFHPICEQGGGAFTYPDDGDSCGANPQVGIRVESRVSWSQRGTPVTKAMYDDLFDWR